LLFIGRVDPLKGVGDFVPLLKQLKRTCPDISLNIVGGHNSTLDRQFTRHGLAESVVWTGFVPHAQCYEIAARSDIILVPSRKESFGMATVEAMSMGCVPIAYDFPSGSKEIIEHGKSGLLIPLGDIRGWAQCIEILNANRAWLAALSEGAMRRARADFDAHTMSANLVTYIADVMAHAEKNPARRRSGLPPRQAAERHHSKGGYQRLPAGLRERVRYAVCSSPRLSIWMLNRGL
jgi:glycosyltransferase involved in cell wall biosynthesis